MTKPAITDKEHSQWSASATDRNWNCSGALAITDGLPETTNEAADWGTCCHKISEACLRNGQDAIEWVGRMVKGKKHEFEVDEEMADTAQTYIDYVRKRCGENGVDAMIEQQFSLESLNPPFDAGGTADAVIYFPDDKLVEVVDLKGGRGVVVEAKGNPQMRTYALGAMLANPKLEVDAIKVTIVQPRAGHKDGRIRSETFHIIDLVEWTTDLVARMRVSKVAFDEYADVKARKVPLAVWAAKWLNAGDHCKFCKATGFCPVLEQKAMDAAGIWFDDLDQPRISNSPDMLSPERAAALLDAADMMGDWINSVRAYWHGQAESGVSIPNYILVEKEGREKWDEGKEAEAVKIAKAAGLDNDKIYNPAKMRTPKQVRAELKKKKADKAIADITKLSHAPQSGTNLVRETKTTREAATPAVNKHFDILN